MSASIFRLPEGFCGLKARFARDIRKLRRGEKMTQAQLAAAVGISRESVSRIENGAQPRPDTLDEILRVLNVNLKVVAKKGRLPPSRRPRYFDETQRGEYRHFTGLEIRAGRRAEGLSLRDLGLRCGLSASQLSRIERGEGERSAVYADVPADLDLPKADRRTRLVQPELIRLAKLGRREMDETVV